MEQKTAMEVSREVGDAETDDGVCSSLFRQLSKQISSETNSSKEDGSSQNAF